MNTVFDFKNYKKFLEFTLKRGQRTHLAEHLSCNVGYISQVLKGDSNFSLEQAFSICGYLKLTGKEQSFFMLLVHQQRAGSVALEKYYQREIDQIYLKRESIKERVKQNIEISLEDRLVYFSNVNYILVHMALSIPQLQNPEELVKKFKITYAEVMSIIEFLEERNLVENENGRFKTGQTRIHLEKGSSLLLQYHTSARIEIIKSLARNNDDLHYSGIFTMGEKQAKKIKELLLKTIEENELILENSPNEKMFIMGIDFLEV